MQEIKRHYDEARAALVRGAMSADQGHKETATVDALSAIGHVLCGILLVMVRGHNLDVREDGLTTEEAAELLYEHEREQEEKPEAG